MLFAALSISDNWLLLKAIISCRKGCATFISYTHLRYPTKTDTTATTTSTSTSVLMTVFKVNLDQPVPCEFSSFTSSKRKLYSIPSFQQKSTTALRTKQVLKQHKPMKGMFTSTKARRVRSCKFHALIIKSSPALYKYDLPTATVCTCNHQLHWLQPA